MLGRRSNSVTLFKKPLWNSASSPEQLIPYHHNQRARSATAVLQQTQTWYKAGGIGALWRGGSSHFPQQTGWKALRNHAPFTSGAVLSISVKQFWERFGHPGCATRSQRILLKIRSHFVWAEQCWQMILLWQTCLEVLQCSICDEFSLHFNSSVHSCFKSNRHPTYWTSQVYCCVF